VFKEVKLEIQKLERKLERASGYAERKDLREQLRFKQREQTALNRQLAKEVVDDSAIVFCTNIGAGDKLLGNFDVVVIDECAQSLEVSCWIPILKGRRLVVAGDHKQLPPTIKSHKAEQEGLGQTLFERIV
jgi:ATP-dependent RNA/DNA helicase IGHMBP2